MLKQIVAVAAVLGALSSPAFANQCPMDMAAIDAAMAKNPSLSAEKMTEVKKLRAQGEEQHKAGKHKESVETLAKAKSMLGVN